MEVPFSAITGDGIGYTSTMPRQESRTLLPSNENLTGCSKLVLVEDEASSDKMVERQCGQSEDDAQANNDKAHISTTCALGTGITLPLQSGHTSLVRVLLQTLFRQSRSWNRARLWFHGSQSTKMDAPRRASEDGSTDIPRDAFISHLPDSGEVISIYWMLVLWAHSYLVKEGY